MAAGDYPPPPEEPPYGPYDGPNAPAGPSDVPQDAAAEQAVLGALLQQPDLLDQVAMLLNPDDFYQPRHETIYAAIQTMATADQPIDMVTVHNHLRRTEGDTGLRRLGGAPYLHDLTRAAVVPTNATYYAGIVLDAARRRRIQTAGRSLLDAARTTDLTDETALHAAFEHAIDTVEQAWRRDTNPDRPAPPATWAPVNLEPVLAGEHLDPPPTILTRTDGVHLLYDHAVHTISGESESGKTWITLLAALQLLQTDHRVVFIDFEDRADRVIGRLLALGATPQQIRTNFSYIRPDRPLDDTGRNQLEPHLTTARLVVIDGVTEAMTMHGLDLNSNADSANFQELLPRWIADHGPAVAMIDHVVKDKEKQDRFALGAQHKLAGIDGAAYIVKCTQPFGRGKIGHARIDVAKDRPGHVREHTIGGSRTIANFTLDASIDGLVLQATLNSPDGTRAGTDQGFEPTVIMEKVSAYVHANPGCSKQVLEGVLNGKAATKRLAIELLIQRGYIATKQGARGRIEHHWIKPYPDPDEEEE